MTLQTNKLTIAKARQLFNDNKELFRQLVLAEPKPKGKINMSLVWQDSLGRKYYHIDDPQHMHIERYANIGRLMDELRMCMKVYELDQFFDEIDRSVKKNGQVDGERIAFLIHEYRFRRQYALRKDIMFELAASVLVREDETTAWDELLHQEKVNMITNDVEATGNTYDFFHKPLLKDYFPLLDLSKEEWDSYLNSMALRVEAVQRILHSGLLSNKAGKNSNPSEQN